MRTEEAKACDWISLRWVTAASRDRSAGATDSRSGGFTAHEPGQTQQLGYHGNLTPSPCTIMQHLPGMQHNKDLSIIMQRHAALSVTTYSTEFIH